MHCDSMDTQFRVLTALELDDGIMGRIARLCWYGLHMQPSDVRLWRCAMVALIPNNDFDLGRGPSYRRQVNRVSRPQVVAVH